MAKDIKRHLSHLKSSGTTAPAAGDLIYGEIAVGYKDGEERLYIKNSSDNVVTIGVPAGDILNCMVTDVTGDTEISANLSECSPTGRTITITHSTGSAQSGFKKLSSDSYGHITGGSNVALSDLTGLGAVSSARTITTASGLTGGGNLSADRTIGLAATGTSGTYTKVATDAYGRVTSGSATIAESDVVNLTTDLAAKVPTSRTITTASGLTGGGNLSADRTIGLAATGTSGTYGPTADVTGTEGTTIKVPQITTDAYGRVTAVTERILTNKNTTYTAASSVTSVATAKTVGTSARYAREDHVHDISLSTGTGAGQVKIAGKDVSVNGFLPYETGLTSTSDTNIPTSKAVADYVTLQMTSALTYKGSISSNDTLKNAHKVGDVYVVSSAGTYAGKACEVGDYIIANTARASASTVTNADWDAINGENQVENKSASLAAAGSSAIIATVDGTNITITTPSTWKGVGKVGTVTKVSTASGLTGGDITSTGTIGLAATGTSGTYGPTADVTGTEGTTIKIPQITTDAYGRVTSVTERTLTNKNSTYTVNNGTFTISGNGTSVASTSANASANTGLNIKAGSNITITTGSSEITIAGKAGTVTSVTLGAGMASSGTSITTTGTVKAALSSETKSTLAATAMGSTNNRQYAVGLDKNGVLSVNIPWTDTKVTAVDNHYTPTSSTTIAKTASSTTNATWGSSDFVTGVTLYKDAKGHITDMAVSSLQLPTPTTSAFTTVSVVGASTVNVVADQLHDTITFAKDDAIKLTGDATNNKVTFGLGDIVCGDYA